MSRGSNEPLIEQEAEPTFRLAFPLLGWNRKDFAGVRELRIVKPMACRLVINADDLGYSEERDLGIFQCFLNGRSISSASVLANGASGVAALIHAVQVSM